VLIRRFEHVRRVTAAGRRPAGPTESPPSGSCSPLRNVADLVLDTSALVGAPSSVRRSSKRFGTEFSLHTRMTLLSFGYKYGLADGRRPGGGHAVLAHPYWIPELREFTGQDTAVATTCCPGGRLGVPGPLPRPVAPGDGGYRREGKGTAVAVGCTGGKHRSVASPRTGRRLRGEERAHRQRGARRPGPRVTPPRKVTAPPSRGGPRAWARGGQRAVRTLSARGCSPSGSRRWSRWPTTVAVGGAGELGVLPPGDLRMALGALADTRRPARCGASCSSTGSVAAVRWAGQRWATCCWPA